MIKYVVDTNIWLNLPQLLNELNGDIVVPLTVVSELDHQKHQTLDKPNRAYMARQAIRELTGMWEDKDNDRVELYDNSHVKVPENIYSTKYTINDDLIIQTVKILQEERPDDRYILVTNDLGMRIKAETLGLEVLKCDIKNHKEYKGYKQIIVSDDVIDEIYKNSTCTLSKINTELVYNCFYEFVSEINPKKTVLTFFNGQTKSIEKLSDKSNYQMYGKINPLNKEQHYYAHLLYKTDIPCIQIKGSAGSGKAQPLNARVWKIIDGIVVASTIGDLQVGDFILCEDGKSYPILNIYEQGIKHNFKVTFEDGTSTNCCEEHLWETQNGTYELQEIMQNNFKNYPIINLTNKPILYYNKNIDIADFPFEKVKELIIHGIRDFSSDNSSWYIHILRDILNENIIFNYEFRVRLLQHIFEYHPVFKTFQSVDFTDNIYKKAIINMAKSTGYYVDINQDVVFINNYKECIYIKNIIQEDDTEMRCIEVDSPLHCYVTDNFIITHNTLMAVSYAMDTTCEYKQNKFNKFVYVKTLDPVSGKDIGYLPNLTFCWAYI